jgi:hypothetical protein
MHAHAHARTLETEIWLSLFQFLLFQNGQLVPPLRLGLPGVRRGDHVHRRGHPQQQGGPLRRPQGGLPRGAVPLCDWLRRFDTCHAVGGRRARRVAVLLRVRDDRHCLRVRFRVHRAVLHRLQVPARQGHRRGEHHGRGWLSYTAVEINSVAFNP